jgi:hypothetical protein
MDVQEARQFLESTQAALELKIAERLRKSEDEISNRVRTAESKLQTIQQIAWAVGVVAVIFGFSGAWGWKLLLDAKAELDATGMRVAQLSSNLQNLEPTAKLYVELVKKAGDEQLQELRSDFDVNRKRIAELSSNLHDLEPTTKLYAERLQKAEVEQFQRFGEDAKRQADAVLADLRSKLSSTTLLNEMQTRSLKIVNSEGRTLISLGEGTSGGFVQIFQGSEPVTTMGASASGNGGQISIYSYRSGGKQEIAYLGASALGNGNLWLSNKFGLQMLRVRASDVGGDLQLYSGLPGSDRPVVFLGVKSNGHGSLSLANKSGQELLQADASGTGGKIDIHSFSSGADHTIVTLGESNLGAGGLWLFDQSGIAIQK